MDSQDDKVLRWDVVVVVVVVVNRSQVRWTHKMTMLWWDIVVIVVVDRSQVRWTHKMTKCWDETLLLLLLTEVRSDGLTRWQSVEMRRCCCCCCWQKSGQMDSQDDKVLRWDVVVVVVDRSQVRWTHKMTKCWDETLLLLLLLLTEVRSDGLTRWQSVEMRRCCCCCCCC